MKIGKMPEQIMDRAVIKQIKKRNEELILKPKYGVDFAVLELKENENLVTTTNTTTLHNIDIAKISLYSVINNLSISNAKMLGIEVTILLPNKTDEQILRKIIKELEDTCKEYNMSIFGGHTEITDVVNKVVITITGYGSVNKDNLITSMGAKPESDIILTKWIGLESTFYLANQKEKELLTRYPKNFIENAKNFINYIPIIKEVNICKDFPILAMHDVAYGGIFGALWEVAVASKVGLEVDLQKLPMKQETVEFTEFFDLNPYQISSRGSLIIIVEKGNDVVNELNKNGINAVIIGKTTKNVNERIVYNEDERRFLEPPRKDMIYHI